MRVDDDELVCLHVDCELEGLDDDELVCFHVDCEPEGLDDDDELVCFHVDCELEGLDDDDVVMGLDFDRGARLVQKRNDARGHLVPSRRLVHPSDHRLLHAMD